MSFVKRTVPLSITTIVGILMISDLFQLVPMARFAASTTRNWAVIVAGFALLLGVVHLARHHVDQVRRRVPGRWPFSILLLVVMLAHFAVGLGLSMSSRQYQLLFGMINMPLSQVIFSMIAFYLFSAAVRAFQAKNAEATIFLLCACVVVIGNIPFMSILFPSIAQIGPWVTDTPTKGAYRALLMTAAIGIIILGVRTLMGRETAYLGRT